MIIDTNIYSGLDTGKQSAIDAIRGETTIGLPVMVVGELRYGFMNGQRQEENESRLTTFVAQDRVHLLLPSFETTEHYAMLATKCRLSGRALSHNDLWIAALAYESGERFATYDNDFSVLKDIFGDKLVLLPS